MRKFVILLAVFLVTSFAGCSNNKLETETTTEVTTVETTEKATEKETEEATTKAPSTTKAPETTKTPETTKPTPKPTEKPTEKPTQAEKIEPENEYVAQLPTTPSGAIDFGAMVEEDEFPGEGTYF